MGNAIHEMLIDLTDAAFCRIFRSSFTPIGLPFKNGGFPRKGFIKKGVGFIDAVGDFHDHNPFSFEPVHGNVFIGSDNNAFRAFDFLSREGMLDAALSIGFNFDGNAAFHRMLLQAFGRHIGVGNAGRAGRDGKDLVGSFLFCCRSRRGVSFFTY